MNRRLDHPPPRRDVAGLNTDEFTIRFDGSEITCRPGWTIGAALTATGIRSWRSTRREARPAGLFCGIGVCFDCLIILNGQPSVRACLAPAQPGDIVRTQGGAGHDDLGC